ncbi:MAG: fructosamine kinase family protein, partial [Enterococcus sp.]
VSYGHREMDIAMSQLFGGFRQEFIAAYQETFPMRAGWQDRILIYQLYYLLVHLNIFGESYGGAVDRVLALGQV